MVASPALDSSTTAAIDQFAAEVGVDVETATKLIGLGAQGMLDTVISALETDCKATCDSALRGERRIGGHLMIGEMVGRLKILRRTTTRG